MSERSSRIKIGWQVVKSKRSVGPASNSPRYDPKLVKKIKRRVRIFNRELKKFAKFKTYRQYVKVKTNILRNISDSDDSEDELYYSSTDTESSLTASLLTEQMSKTNLSKTKHKGNSRDAENLCASMGNATPGNTRTPVRRNLTSFFDNLTTPNLIIVENCNSNDYNDNNNNTNSNNDSEESNRERMSEKSLAQITKTVTGDSKIDDNSRDHFSVGNGESADSAEFDDKSETSQQQDLPPQVPSENGISLSDVASNVTNEQINKTHQPTITCTTIVKSKYTIIRNNNEKQELCCEECSSDREILSGDEIGRTSPENKQLGQLKNIDLTGSIYDGDSCRNYKILDVTSDTAQYQSTMPSQLIDELSDSNDDEIDEATPLCLTYLSDSDGKESTPIGSSEKSIKCQIEEQENAVDPLLIVEGSRATDDETDEATRAGSGKQRVSDAESLRYVLNNVCKSSNIIDGDLLRNIRDQDPLELVSNHEEIPTRPIELRDFVARQGLVPSYDLSTMTVNDVSTNCAMGNEDEEIWLMEIPRTIMTDSELCGKRMVLEKGNMRIGDVSYDTSLRHVQSLSCILRKGRKKARYKTVNITPVRSIIVRHEKKPFAVAAESLRPSRISVPFPKNVKLRNPLGVEK